MSKKNKQAPKIHTKNFVLHVLELEDKILIMPADSRAFMHFKRWAYQCLSSKSMYWDQTAKIYVVDLAKTKTTTGGFPIVGTLKKYFTVKAWLPFEV